MLTTSLLFVTACSTKNAPQVNTPSSNDDRTEVRTLKSEDTAEMKTLKSALDNYTKATINNDVTALMNFVYPKVFTIVPKEKMTEVLTQAYASGKVPVIKNIKHLNIEPIQKYNAGRFTFVDSSMTTELKSPRPDNEKFEAFMLKTLKKQIEAQGGSVTFDKDSHVYTVNHTEKTLALNENNGWKFAGVNQAKMYAKKGLLPQEIVAKLP